MYDTRIKFLYTCIDNNECVNKQTNKRAICGYFTNLESLQSKYPSHLEVLIPLVFCNQQSLGLWCLYFETSISMDKNQLCKDSLLNGMLNYRHIERLPVLVLDILLENVLERSRSCLPLICIKDNSSYEYVLISTNLFERSR